MESPSARAALARDLLNLLPDNQIVYVDRLGPRILSVPLDPAVRLGRQTLRDLDKGNLAGSLDQGARFLSKRMMQCPEITVSANGQYTVEKKQSNHNAPNPRSFTVQTLDIWTGKPGELHEDRNLDDLVFYSVAADELPAYHSWTTDKMERRESSVELERQEELALAEQEYAKSPKPLADMIDEYKEKLEDMMDESASNDAENMLRFRPDIGPSDPAWEGLEEHFKWILQFEREEIPEAPQVYRVLQDELLESQRLLAIPAISSGYRAKIQDEHTKKYHEALATTFDGKPDNLATKLTMLCFGLPIEPLTAANVKFAGGLEDVPTHDIEHQGHGQTMERIIWSENPLEFLDRYNERSYGYPMIRTQKRKHEELDSDTMESMLTQAQERSKHPRLLWDGCGFSQIENLEQGLHLRGGGGAPAELPGKPRKRTYLLYTDLGRFIMNADNSFNQFWHLTQRLFQLESVRNWNFQIDLIPVLPTESGAVLDTTEQVHHRTWSKSKVITSYIKNYENFVIHVMDPDHMRRLRVRNNPGFPLRLTPTDIWEPPDNQSLVNLEVRDVGIAYWYIPSSPVAVNIRQETFRNAVECLLPQHRNYLVRWSIKSTAGTPDQDGQILLMAEAPSMALWNTTQKALGSGKRVTITLEVIDDRSSEREVKILMPGLNQKGRYDRNYNEDFGLQNTEIFPAVRNFAPVKTGSDKFPLRIWSGVQNYDDIRNMVNETKDSLSMILPTTSNPEAESNIWMSEGLAYTWDTVVVKADFESFMIHCLTSRTKENQPSRDYLREEHSVREGLLTLARFRKIVSRMSNGFNEEQHYISIELASSDNIFWVGPGMTQRQWHFQVFSWFDRPNLYYRVHKDWPIRYSKDIIEGPLGPTYNGLSHFLPLSIPPEGVRRNTPPLLDDPKSVINRPETGEKTKINRGRKPTSPQSNSLATKPSIELPVSPPLVTSTQQLLNPSLWSTTKPSLEPLVRAGTEICTLPVATIPPIGESATGPAVGPLTGSSAELLVRPPLGGQIRGPGIKPARKDPFQGRSSSQVAVDAYREYQKKDAEQEQKRVEAYSHDESIHQHGQGPEIPRFGPAIEGNIPVVARNFPTIFTAMSTPTENVDRDRELESLKKIALERLDYCGVCQLALPAGPHNSAVRERHFQNHRDLQDGHLQNLTGKLNQAVGFTIQDVYYCEFCGKTLAEFKKDNNGLGHGPSCALRNAFNGVPQYCQYCRRNFWDNHMTSESVLSHVQNCANIRRVSPQGQIALYQTLLSRGVGHQQPNGASTCHFEGCRQTFNSTTTNIARADHFLQHLDRNDKARRCSDEDNTRNAQGGNTGINPGGKSCPFQECNRDLTGMAGDEMIAHLQEHIGWDDDDSCPIPHCGMELKELNVDQVLGHLLEHMNDETENNLKCPFDGCNELFRNKRWEEIMTHFNWHSGTNRRLCPVKTCGKELLGLDLQQLRKHFEWHFGLGRHLCPFLGCGEDIRGYTEAAFKTHFDTHYGGPGRICPFPSCGIDLANFSYEADEAHIRKHVYIHRCPFQHCKMDLDEYNELRRKAHLNNHLGQRRDLKDHRCPVEGCDTFMRAWTEKKRFEHFTNHFIANGERPLWPSSNCPFENCNHSFTGLSQADIAHHLRIHSTGPQAAQEIQRTRCQLCVFHWNGADVEMLRTHFHFTHYPENPADFVCPLCHVRVTNKAGTVMTHYRNHVNDLYCTWEGCHYQHPVTATSDDRRRHLLTHVGQVCQWPGCAHIAPQLSTTAASAEERRQHLLQHVRRFCPWEKCETTFPENVTPRDIEQHILHTHISGCQWPRCHHRFQEGELHLDADTKNHYRDHVRRSPGRNQPAGESMKDSECQWPGCSHDFDEKTEPVDIENHYRTHLPNQCPVPGCQMVFAPNTPDKAKSRHVRTHMSRRCPIPGCDFKFRELAAEDEKRNHVAAHMTIKCPVPACPFVFRDAATDEEKIQHIRDHINMGGTWASSSKEHQCHWPGCAFVFDANIRSGAIERHIRSHVEQVDTGFQPVAGQPVTGTHTVTGTQPVSTTEIVIRTQPVTGTQPVPRTEAASITPPIRIQRCFWPNCAVEFKESSTAAERVEHFRTHLHQQCPFPGCGQEFEAGVPVLKIRRHFHTHLPQECSFPDCSFIFPTAMTDEQKIMHMHTHCSQKCQWPDCVHLYLEEPTDEDVIAHYIAHARTYGIQPETRELEETHVPGSRGPDPQIPDPPGTEPEEPHPQVVGPQAPDPSGGEPVEEDQDNVPQRLRDAHPGQEFYCPHCLHKVSGGNSSACRRHRKAPCNTNGHSNWRIGTADDRRQWQADKKSGNVSAPNNPAPRTTAGNNRGDPTYRPPATGEEETEEDDQPVVPSEPRWGGRGDGRKRKRGGNDGGDTAGSTNKRQRR